MDTLARWRFFGHGGAVAATTVILSTMLLLVGCSTHNHTLAQDRVWAAEQVCKAEVPGFRITQVAPDGRYGLLVDDAGKATRAQQCMDREVQSLATPPAATTGVAALNAPVWNVGDEWAYRYYGAIMAGTFVWSVVRAEVMDDFECYVVKEGDREIFWRKRDLALVREVANGLVVRRDVPPRLYYQWPLVVGNRWQQDLTFENWRDKITSSLTFSWEVVGAEQLTVPAGRFHTLKIVSRNERMQRTINEWWYAPEVKQFVKIHEWRDAGEHTRELIAYKLR